MTRTHLLLIATAGLCGCSMLFPPPSVAPVPTIPLEGGGAAGNDTLVVLLPGRGDRASTFMETGFADASNGSGYDLVAVDAHVGYYADRTLPLRLHEDVVLPAREDGYGEIWILGISLGGLGGILYANEYPAGADGYILLAPFLGNACVVDEIAAAGGLRSWSGASRCNDGYEADVWAWLKRNVETGEAPVVLGYGTEDRFASTFYDPLVEALAPARIHTRAGGHDWTTWTRLWGDISAAEFAEPAEASLSAR